jgi:hypothetical protein
MSDEEEGLIPTTGAPIPAEHLALRQDSSWEAEQDDVRIAMVMEWAMPLLERIQQLASLGLDVKTDDEFSNMVDEVYNGVRDRLTRQDLVRALLLHMGQNTAADADEVGLKMDRDLRALDRPGAIDRFFQS